MARNLFGDPIVHTEIARSRRCIERSKDMTRTAGISISASRDAIRASHVLIRSLPVRTRDAADLVDASGPLKAMDDEAIGQVVSAFTAAYAAYLEARDTGDEVAEVKSGKILGLVGRRLTARLGPDAAGVLVN